VTSYNGDDAATKDSREKSFRNEEKKDQPEFTKMKFFTYNLKYKPLPINGLA